MESVPDDFAAVSHHNKCAGLLLPYKTFKPDGLFPLHHGKHNRFVIASGGGTDIVAMIVKKYSDMNIAMALFLVDLLISVSAWFVFGAQTGLFSRQKFFQ